MYNIKIVDKVINFDLVFNDYFKNMKKYITDESPDYYVKSIINDFTIPEIAPILKSTSVDYYEIDGISFQINKIDNKVIGKITYCDKILIELKEKTMYMNMF